MIESSSLEEDIIVKDARNLYRKKEIDHTVIKNIRNLLDYEKKIKQLKIE